MRNREGCQGGGKGPMLADELSFTLATSNDQILFIMKKPIGIDGEELGFALRAGASHSGDKGDGGVNTSMVVETEVSPALQSGGGQLEKS